MDAQFKLDLTKALEYFADGEVHEDISDSNLNMGHIKWLHDAGFLKGIDISTIHAATPAYMDIGITLSGAQFLEQSRNEIAQRPRREAAYEKNYPMRSKVVVGITVSLLAALVIYIFGWIAHG